MAEHTLQGDGITTPLTVPSVPMDRRLLHDSHLPALAVDHTAWNWLPVYSFSAKTRLWYGKIPGTTWGRLRPAAFYERRDCLAWLQNEYRALYGLGPDVVVVCRYEPPVRRWKLTPEQMADAFARGTERLTAEERITRRHYEALPGQLRALDRFQRAALETQLAPITNTLQALEHQRSKVSPDTYLETRRQARTNEPEPYDGDKAPDEIGGPWPEWDHELATMYVTLIKRGRERVLYAPWVWLKRGGETHAYAHYVFPSVKAAEAYCYDLGARWIVRQNNWAIQKQDQEHPLSLYINPAWVTQAQTLHTDTAAVVS